MAKENKDLEGDTGEKKCPISVDCWLMLLSDKILDEETKFFQVGNQAIVIALALMGAIAVVVSGAFSLFQSTAIGIYFLVVVFIFHKRIRRDYIPKAQIRLRHLRKIREDIISGETNSNKIREKWEEYVKIEEDSDKMNSRKKIDEQKENLQVPQSEVRDIKESLQEIKDMMEGTKYSRVSSTAGSVFIAIGILIMATAVGVSPEYTSFSDSLILSFS